MEQGFERLEGRIYRTLSIGGAVWRTSVRDVADGEQAPAGAWWQSVLRGERVAETPAGTPLKIVDAFCGPGGLSLGLKLAAEAVGRRAVCSAIIDTDEGALAVHRANSAAKHALACSVSSVVDYHVTGTGKETRFAYPPEVLAPQLQALGSVDVFVAGPPCEGHSNLNNHTRRDDPRNQLYLTSVALGVALGAKTILIENVPTVQRDKSGIVEQAQCALESEGYAITAGVLRANELGGAQRRARFFLLAWKGERGTSCPLEDAAAALKLPEASVGDAIVDLLDCEPVSLFDTAATTNEVNQARIDYLFDNDLHNLPDAERPDCHKNGTTYTSVYGRMRLDEPAQTITTGFNTPGQGRYVHPVRRRVITPHEAARLQGFPDWYTFEAEGSDLKRKHLAKWIGDAVHPLLGYAAGMAALSVLSRVET